jgi:nitrite reductase/ring-hydroxylating ferredoxin subunit
MVGRLLALAGAGALGAGGYLGGHLSYSRGIGVNHAFMDQGPSDWTPVLAAGDLHEHEPVRVEVDGTPVLLYRDMGQILAIGARCTHAGGPLDEGTFDDRGRCVQCPWHNSVVSLESGEALHGPASVPQPVFDVMVQDDKIVIRGR